LDESVDLTMNANLIFNRRTKILFLIIALAAPLLVAPAHATVQHRHYKPRHHAGVDGTASYADIVIDAETGRILHASDPDSPRHPASLSKMMTLYLVFQALETGRLRLDQSLPVSANAAEQSPSKLGLRHGQHIRVEDAILGVVTESANDAAMVLAEGVGGNETRFGQMMTEEAHALGMNHSNFHNPSGLPDPRQVTTARDMAVLGHALIYHFPQFYSYFSRASFTYAGIPHANHNHLMERYEGMDGIKTGYIRASGFNLVASAVRGNVRLIGVVFGGHSTTERDNQMAQLLDQAFAAAESDSQYPHMASETSRPDFPQGDSANFDEENEYVTLPAKIPAVLNVPTTPAGGWGIQIGAYNDPAIGRQALAGIVQAMPQLLSRAEPVVQEVSAGGVTMFRARLQAIDEKTARSVCAYLVHHGQSCLTVAPALTISN
jgi:D-alanyl-D-alanine carboxypeptidase